MKCALAAMGFIDGDIQYNKSVIIDTMKNYSDTADIVIFGEAFLQGFYCADFNVEHDEKIAVSRSDSIITEICSAAEKYKLAVSFGFIEKEGDLFYSSQLTVDQAGKVIDLYRRVSPGWKESFADEHYREGEEFHSFLFLDRKVVVGLCGDLWFDTNIDRINKLHPDIVFWPVYTDFNEHEWNTSEKLEYAAQAGRIKSKVLYVNSLCKDREADDIARGGAALFAGMTCTPRLLKKEANSIPITPPPIMASEAGSSLLSKASRCVQKGTVSTPGIGGMNVSEPVHKIRFSHS